MGGGACPEFVEGGFLPNPSFLSFLIDAGIVEVQNTGLKGEEEAVVVVEGLVPSLPRDGGA